MCWRFWRTGASSRPSMIKCAHRTRQCREPCARGPSPSQIPYSSSAGSTDRKSPTFRRSSRPREASATARSYNVADESRLKSEYWKAVASKRRPLHEHVGKQHVLQPAANLVRVWIFIEKDEVGYPESQDWEDLWGRPTTEGRLVIESVPFFAKGVARRDQVTAVVSREGFPAVDKITERGGHSTFRIWLAEDFVGLEQVLNDLIRLGAVAEVTLQRLLAIDADPEHESSIWDYLQEGAQKAAWEVQVGYSPD